MKMPEGVIKAVEMVNHIKNMVDPHEYDYSSTQFDLPKGLSRDIIEFGLSIPDEELQTDDEKGREDCPHITILYGLKTTDDEDIEKIVKGIDPVSVTLGDVDYFVNEEKDYDVVKVNVTGSGIVDLHNRIKDELEAPGYAFNKYNPHITIAYVKKGKGKKYKGDSTFKDRKVIFNELTFSSHDGKCEYISFG